MGPIPNGVRTLKRHYPINPHMRGKPSRHAELQVAPPVNISMGKQSGLRWFSVAGLNVKFSQA